ncbi:MAG: polyamine-transporting ATPase [Alphaproteobacteria bacterium]|nr:MAG: polyamine-transporting ATPase [Alphaproteobacteria bacterium]
MIDADLRMPPLRRSARRPAAAPGHPDIVAFEHVQKSFDGRTLVVHDLNLTVRHGEFLTLLGPSGSGKTTCLMMLAGFERPTSGRILLDGAPIEELRPERRNIGMVFQNYALFPHMSVAENVGFSLRYHGIRGAAARDRVARVLAMVRLEGLSERRPSQLSGGQQQRVALARALVFEPRLVLMDEPLGALDKQLRERMQIEIKHLQLQLGITVVFVTHDQSEALTMSHRVAVFNDGRIQQVADPVTLYDRPANRFVAGFIGENNLLDCELRRDGPGLVALTPDGTRLFVAGAAAAAAGPATLVIRPERLQPAERAASPSLHANRIPARILESYFLGDHALVRVAALGADDVAVKLPANMLAEVSLEPGAELTLACRPEDCRILAE